MRLLFKGAVLLTVFSCATAWAETPPTCGLKFKSFVSTAKGLKIQAVDEKEGSWTIVDDDGFLTGLMIMKACGYRYVAPKQESHFNINDNKICGGLKSLAEKAARRSGVYAHEATVAAITDNLTGAKHFDGIEYQQRLNTNIKLMKDMAALFSKSSVSRNEYEKLEKRLNDAGKTEVFPFAAAGNGEEKTSPSLRAHQIINMMNECNPAPGTWYGYPQLRNLMQIKNADWADGTRNGDNPGAADADK